MSEEPTVERLQGIARSLELITDTGNLKQLDSLNILDLAIEIERVLDVRIPTGAMIADNFVNLDSVATMLRSLRELE